MADQFSGPTPDGGGTANPATDPGLTSGTANPSGDANGQSAPAPEEVFGNVDPKTLPPQLKSVYDNMLKGFKEKTTKLSETAKSLAAKEIEPYSKKAQAYDQMLQNEEFVKRWNAYVEETNAKSQQQNLDPNDPNAKILQEVQELKKSQEELRFQARQTEAKEIIGAFADAVDDKGEKLHPEFDKFSTFSIGKDGEGKDMDLLRAAIECAGGNTPQEKLDAGYKAAKAVYDAIYEEGKKAGMGRLQDKVRGATNPPSSVAPTKAAPGRPKDALEALQWARKGLAVQR